jgi:hypothetical protein
VDIVQADGFHLYNAPGDGASGVGRAGDARTDVVTQFFEVLVSVGFHVAGAGDGDESFHGAVVGRGCGSLLSFTWGGNCGARRQQQERRAAQEREDFSSHAKAPFLMPGKSRGKKWQLRCAATS